jgi:hypothetical protein
LTFVLMALGAIYAGGTTLTLDLFIKTGVEADT